MLGHLCCSSHFSCISGLLTCNVPLRLYLTASFSNLLLPQAPHLQHHRQCCPWLACSSGSGQQLSLCVSGFAFPSAAHQATLAHTWLIAGLPLGSPQVAALLGRVLYAMCAAARSHALRSSSSNLLCLRSIFCSTPLPSGLSSLVWLPSKSSSPVLVACLHRPSHPTFLKIVALTPLYLVKLPVLLGTASLVSVSLSSSSVSCSDDEMGSSAATAGSDCIWCVRSSSTPSSSAAATSPFGFSSVSSMMCFSSSSSCTTLLLTGSLQLPGSSVAACPPAGLVPAVFPAM
mmetsp:Transcript_55547/g.107139  ORF Transcript_55547/g.107139 Transcript_55547/m.107139 type:complete len:288 (-) Transcript_55547:283-1146(-)